MKLLLLLLIVLSGCATSEVEDNEPLVIRIDKDLQTQPIELSAITCKEFEIKSGDECNTCTCMKCTDGKTQWDNGQSCTCTSAYCQKKLNEEKFNPKLWNMKEND